MTAVSSDEFPNPEGLDLPALIESLLEQGVEITPAMVRDLVDGLPPDIVTALAFDKGATVEAGRIPDDPAAQAAELDDGYVIRDHLRYLADRLAQALAGVEAGQSRHLVISLPPRAGKSTLISLYLILWILRKHPDWKIGMISHEDNFAISWGRRVRRVIEKYPSLGVALAADLKAAGEWETIQEGGVLARSTGGSITGRGFKIVVMDDIVKGYAAAHSQVDRDKVWDWWTGDMQNRLEEPYLAVAVGTRWHQDDFLGRLLSTEYEGNPEDWEEIKFPAIAEDADVLGRMPGEPLLSPLLPNETPTEAVERWERRKRAIGTYNFQAQYQQAPSAAKGEVFDADWWRFWTNDPKKATEDGRIRYLNPEESGPQGKWVDSWDMAFKDKKASDYVVGQRWMRLDANRYLIAQYRRQIRFTKTVAAVKVWAELPLDEGETAPEDVGAPVGGRFVHRRLVEDKANGTAVIDTLKEKIAGMIPINPTTSKEARAVAVTPECESGNVYLPLPSDPGNEWVEDLLSELREFPHSKKDDQVDALTQALTDLRDPGVASMTVPGRAPGSQIVDRRITQTALAAGGTRRFGQGGPGVRRAGGR